MSDKVNLVDRCRNLEAALEHGAVQFAEMEKGLSNAVEVMTHFRELLASILHHFLEEDELDQPFEITDDMRRAAWDHSRLRVATQMLEKEEGNAVALSLVPWTEEDEELSKAKAKSSKLGLLDADGGRL